MAKITIYDADEERVDEICEKNDISPAYFISAILDAIEDGEIDIDEIF